MKTVFVQPFSILGNGGGARILRSVVERAPCETEVVVACAYANPASGDRETLLYTRPPLGRLDRSRLAWMGSFLEEFWRGSFRRRLRAHLLRTKAAAVHVVPHSGGDFFEAWSAARGLGLRVVMSLHDDLDSTARGHPFVKRLGPRLAQVWQDADHRFVISGEMGRMCCERYGQRPFERHTDFAERAAQPALREAPDVWRLFFMGLYQLATVENFQMLHGAVERLRERGVLKLESFRLRGAVPPNTATSPSWATFLPLADDAQVQRDLAESHLAYLPLPLGQEHREAMRLALSTKMISYLAAGLPILAHVPGDSAVAGFLKKHQAGIVSEANDPVTLAAVLEPFFREPARLVEMARRAWECAGREFAPEVVVGTFWKGMLGQ